MQDQLVPQGEKSAKKGDTWQTEKRGESLMSWGVVLEATRVDIEH